MGTFLLVRIVDIITAASIMGTIVAYWYKDVYPYRAPALLAICIMWLIAVFYQTFGCAFIDDESIEEEDEDA